ncbi:hypothetical protein BpHYR1_046288 [Brachionus plicatilis]|uniref:Transmembrane protein n=1 Tax=Brachionus plicatilis TaxID=10195 RepID=A0A3M7RYM8_BRAPC|nr:hypothetical protein BpHYR1_046288 [Brachionus plicatilis]
MFILILKTLLSEWPHQNISKCGLVNSSQFNMKPLCRSYNLLACNKLLVLLTFSIRSQKDREGETRSGVQGLLHNETFILFSMNFLNGKILDEFYAFSSTSIAMLDFKSNCRLILAYIIFFLIIGGEIITGKLNPFRVGQKSKINLKICQITLEKMIAILQFFYTILFSIFLRKKAFYIFQTVCSQQTVAVKVLLFHFDSLVLLVLFLFYAEKKYYSQITKIDFDFSGQKSLKSHFDSLVLLVFELLITLQNLFRVEILDVAKLLHNIHKQSDYYMLRLLNRNLKISINKSKLRSIATFLRKFGLSKSMKILIVLLNHSQDLFLLILSDMLINEKSCKTSKLIA